MNHFSESRWNKLFHYSIRKTTLGVGSVVVGVFLFGLNPLIAHADTSEATVETAVTNLSPEETVLGNEKTGFQNNDGVSDLTEIDTLEVTPKNEETPISLTTIVEDNESEVVEDTVAPKKLESKDVISTEHLIQHFDFDNSQEGDRIVEGDKTDKIATLNGDHITIIDTKDDIFKKAISFGEGSGSYLKIDNAINTGENSYTFSTWMKYDSSITEQIKNASAVVFQQDGVGRTLLNIKSTGQLNSYVNARDVTSTEAIRRDKWEHVAISLNQDSHKGRFYINGTFINEVDLGNNVVNRLTSLLIGTHKNVNNNNPHQMRGLLDEIRIYDSVLNDEDVTKLYEEKGKPLFIRDNLNPLVIEGNTLLSSGKIAMDEEVSTNLSASLEVIKSNQEEVELSTLKEQYRHLNEAIKAYKELVPLKLVINADDEIRTIDAKHIFGINHRYAFNGYGTFDEETGKVNEEFAELYKKAGFGSIRYPGGTISNLFNWKTAIGPMNDRKKQIHGFYNNPNQGGIEANFGLSEIATFAKEVDSEMVYVYSLGRGNSQDVADLMEFLNAKVGTNPNGGVDWAQVRSDLGHKDPFNIKFFEIGNEMNQGNANGEGRYSQTYWTAFVPGKNTLQAYTEGGRAVFNEQYAVDEEDWNQKGSLSTGEKNLVRFMRYANVNPKKYENGKIIDDPNFTAVERDSVHVFVGTGNDKEEWTIVNDFSQSNATDKHVVIDYSNGSLHFGDNIHGKIPEKNKAILVSYAVERQGFVQISQAMKETMAQISQAESEDKKALVFSGYDSPAFIQNIANLGKNDLYDGMTVHPYSGTVSDGNNPNQFYDNAMKKAEDVGIHHVEEYVKLLPEGKVPVISEFGIFRNTEPQLRSLTHALYIGKTLMEYVKLGSPYIQKHALVDWYSSGADALGPTQQAVIQAVPQTGASTQTGKGKFKYFATPSAHIFQMFNEGFGDSIISGTITEAPKLANETTAVSTLTSKDKDGNIYIALVNIDREKDYNIELALSGLAIEGALVDVQTLTANSITDENSLDNPDNVHVVNSRFTYHKGDLFKLTPHSFVLLKIHNKETKSDIIVNDNNNYEIHYTTPAHTTYAGWERESLPTGNGDIGTKTFGLVGGEKIQFNEKTLWSGGPTTDSTDYNGGNYNNRYTVIPEIRKALEEGNTEKAKQLAESQLVGPNNAQYGRYLSFGDVFVDFSNETKDISEVTDYHRKLDLKTAVSSTDYTHLNQKHHRETFVSYPDNVSVTHFTKTGSETLAMNITLKPTMDLVAAGFANYSNDKSQYKEAAVTYSENGALLSGRVKDNGLKFASYLKVDSDGQVTRHDDHLSVVGATYVTLYLSAETNFAQNPKTNYRNTAINVEDFVQETANKASDKGFEAVKADHIADYQSLFNRVRLNITSNETNAPTNTLLSGYSEKTGQELEELFFQYGRYLMISSSRDGVNALPANLQGVWNAVDNPPWNSDYHLNVNLQMNYWPVYSTNTAEAAIPLINYIDDMRYFGRIAAEEYAGIVSNEGEENGWLVHTQATPFGWTTPGWSYYWGWSPASNAWIMQNVYDYYKFTKNEEYLREKIYPMLKETAKFWNSFLHYDEASDRYVSSPSYSPEHGTITIGNTYDQSLVWQLFHDFMEAANVLKVDADLVDEIKVKFDKLKPLHINNKGQIKEWYEEDTPAFTGTGVEKGHRHVSNLVGLFPGTLFSKDHPEFLEAAKATLNDRGDGGTGWSKANKINLWARLLDGNRAHRLLSEQLKGSTLTNLWDTHTPFQIDGNFGATSGMTEMLLQSHTGYIAPLPALPDAWKTGQVSGLVARGNVEVDMSWEEKNLTKLVLKAKKDGGIQLDYPSIEKATVLINGEKVDAVTVQSGRIALELKNGDTVVVSDFLARIMDITATRQSSKTAQVSFSPLADSHYYNIKRETVSDTGEVTETRIFKTKEASFVDQTINSKGSYRYFVQAVTKLGTNDYSPSAVIYAMKDIMDDRDSSIRYGSSFGDWSDSQLYGGTEKYADITNNRHNVSDDSRTATISFIGSGIEVYGLKSTQLGKASVTIDGVDVQELDFYASGATQKGVLIGRYDGLEEKPHVMTISVKKEATTRGERNKISLDFFKVLRDTSKEFETLDDRDSRVQYGSGYHDWPDSALYGGTEKYADFRTGTFDAKAATATLNFEGNGIKIYGIKSNQLGKAKVTIDGIAQDDLDFYVSGATQKGVLIGEYTGLGGNSHTITIQVDEAIPTRGTRKISLDYFVITKPEEKPLYPATLSEIEGSATTLNIQLPENDWTTISVSLPEIENPIIITNGETLTVNGNDFQWLENENSVLLTLPETITSGLVSATTYKEQTSIGEDFILIKQEITEDKESTDNPETGSDGDSGNDGTDESNSSDNSGEADSSEKDNETDSHETRVPNNFPTYELPESDFVADKKVPDTAPTAEDKPSITFTNGSGVVNDLPELVFSTEKRELKDDLSGVLVQLEVGEIAHISGISVGHKETQDPNTPNVLKDQDYDLFDISLVDAKGEAISPLKDTLVIMPIDDGKVVEKVVYLPNTDQAEELDFEMTPYVDADGVTRQGVVFVAKHFSEYGIVYQVRETRVPSDAPNYELPESDFVPETSVPKVAPKAQDKPVFEGTLESKVPSDAPTHELLAFDGKLSPMSKGDKEAKGMSEKKANQASSTAQSKALPNTGDASNSAVLGTMLALSSLALYGYGRKKRDNID
ncbi:glycoside hydrolase N-terminal domain-containing protein [Streptococcus sp. CSL7508-lung]|uniref:non-reducing end alpha-L-arabinofuranosidase n=2 Tax=Streptococcus zalophi TaxID=640031 RepID=A0A934PBP4_9STRE|nr:glycoside hydrolase N-terminal domain-containing protein [Streptococcus zalophi]MBJ8350434.1 glycoside hydrolase N-terminal domain-containing protein [Streptococcus zalophi]